MLPIARTLSFLGNFRVLRSLLSDRSGKTSSKVSTENSRARVVVEEVFILYVYNKGKSTGGFRGIIYMYNRKRLSYIVDTNNVL